MKTMQKDYYWLNKKSRTFLKRGYIVGEQTPEERVRQIAEAAERILKEEERYYKGVEKLESAFEGFADKFELYMKRGWYSLASPVWANFGLPRGLPISCNGSYIADNMAAILDKVGEIGMMSKHGSGTSAYFGDLRPRGASVSVGGTSSGPVHFMELFDTVTEVVSQSGVRRGNCAAYLPIEHPDIEEFLQIRGDGHAIQHMSIGITVTDAWMVSMIQGDVEKRRVWAKVIQKRCESGYPYIMWIDTVNNNAPQVYKDKGKKIYASNLCSEICLSSDENESFVCDLSSMNLEHYDDWKNTDAVEVMIYFLDAVMSEYITKVKDIAFMKAPYHFAVNQRALGLGVLGWHSYLQANMIAFESLRAKGLTNTIFKFLREEADAATAKLAALLGEPPLLKGYGRRNVTTLAIAPTTSSSFILGQVSPSIEPLESNYFVKNLAKGTFTYKNPLLKQLLSEKGKDDAETWKSILERGGSVSHLDFLTQEEKDVFKTFGEISQKEVIIQASIRQKYIDQSQSLNITVPPSTSVRDINALLITAWKLGVKTLYYQHSTNPAQDLNRNILTCVSCQA